VWNYSCQGIGQLRSALPLVLEHETNGLSALMRELVGEMAERLRTLDDYLRRHDQRIAAKSVRRFTKRRTWSSWNGLLRIGGHWLVDVKPTDEWAPSSQRALLSHPPSILNAAMRQLVRMPAALPYVTRIEPA
jgi:hypothetical protein